MQVRSGETAVAGKMMRWFLLLAIALGNVSLARAATAPDATKRGSYAVGLGSYALAPKLDRELSDELKTQIAAAVWYPKNAPASEPRPLLVFLHGNHATCGRYDKELKIRVDDDTTYTYDGKCPKGYIQTPSHMGYHYLADRLASWGYVVVSINANRGVNGAPDTFDDPSLILRRGRLILRHLQQLATWHRAGGTPKSVGIDLRGRLDFANIGMLGHSRGGDGIVAAHKLLLDKSEPWAKRLPANTLVKGLFAIAPTDAQESQPAPLDAPFAVLLPMCDGDVSDLQGLRFFERAMAKRIETRKSFKATFAVWGANHNYYNSEWQESDATGCVGHKPLFDMSGGSTAQRNTAFQPVLAFFRSTVGRRADKVFARLLDSSWYPPAPFRDLTELDRAYSSSPDRALSWLVEDFAQSSLKSKAGVKHKLVRGKAAAITIPDHEKRGLAFAWQGASAAKRSSLLVTLAKSGSSINMTGWSSVEIRMTMGCGGTLSQPDCYDAPPVKDGVSLKGDIVLVDANGKRSVKVPIEPFARMFSPVGVDYEGYYFVRHPVLSSVRIPTVAFKNIDRTRLKAIEFSFGGQMPKGTVYLADLRLSKAQAQFPWGMKSNSKATVAAAQARTPQASAVIAAEEPRAMTAARAKAARTVHRASLSLRRGLGKATDGGSRPMVELVIDSDRPFPVMGNGMLLRIGDATLRGGSFARDGGTGRVVFRLSEDRFAELPEGAEVTLFGLASHEPWRVGRLAKSSLR